jgi:hypothetical protein
MNIRGLLVSLKEKLTQISTSLKTESKPQPTPPPVATKPQTIKATSKPAASSKGSIIAIPTIVAEPPAIVNNIEVTNTSDSGTGSMHWAMAQLEGAQNRAVVFRVGGNFNCLRPMYLADSQDIVIDGMQAPAPVIINGTRLRGDHVMAFDRCRNVVVKGIAIHKGDSIYTPDAKMGDSEQGAGPLGIWESNREMYFYRCEFMDTQDENFTVYGDKPNQHIVLEECVFAEPFSKHPTNVIFGPGQKNVIVLHSLFANASHRNPWFSGGKTTGALLNNIFYNWQWWCTAVTDTDNIVDIENNVYIDVSGEDRRKPISLLEGGKHSIFLNQNLWYTKDNKCLADRELVEEVRKVPYEGSYTSDFNPVGKAWTDASVFAAQPSCIAPTSMRMKMLASKELVNYLFTTITQGKNFTPRAAKIMAKVADVYKTKA